MDSKLGLSDWLVSNWANAGAKAAKAKAGVTLSLDVIRYTNDNEAMIQSGALINQDLQSPGQSVSVNATTTYNSVTFSGNTYIDLSPDNTLKTIRKNGAGSIFAQGLAPTQGSIAAAGASLNFTFLNNTTISSIGSVPTFDPTAALESDGKTIDLNYYPGLETGEKVVYSSNGGVPITGLSRGQIYYAVVDANDRTHVKLAATYANAEAGIALSLGTSAGTGTSQSLQALNPASTAATFDGSSASVVLPSVNTIVLGSAPGFRTGEAVAYDNGGGTNIGGLASGAVYYVIVNPAAPGQVKLAASAADARAGKAIALTGPGTGKGQSLTGLDTRVNFGSGGVTVEAGQNIFNLSLGTSAGGTTGSSNANPSALGINGAFSLVNLASVTQALVGSGAVLMKNANTAGNVNVSANDDSTFITLAGAVSGAKNLGLGVSGAVNTISRTTSAIVGADPAGPTSPWVSLWNVAGNITVQSAETGTVDAFVVTGTSVAPPSFTAFDEGDAGVSVFGSWGVGISGGAAVTSVTDNTNAILNDAGSFTAKAVSVTAADSTFVLNVTGSVALTTNGGAEPSGTTFGFAGAASVNQFRGSTEAIVENATLNVSSITIDAKRSVQLDAVAAGTSFSTVKANWSVVGSVAINSLSTADVEALLKNVNANVSGDVNVTAEDGLSVMAIAGALTVTAGRGIGAAVALNSIVSNLRASINGSTLKVRGNVNGSAANKRSILGVAAGVAASVASSGFSMALVGSGVGNDVSGNTQAVIENGSQVTTTNNGSVALTASDTSTVQAGAGVLAIGVSFGAGSPSLAFGASAATNAYGSGSASMVTAAVEGSVVTAANGVSLTATFDPSILAVAAAGAGSYSGTEGRVFGSGLAVTGAGAGTSNTIASDVEARVTGGSMVKAGNGGLTLAANNTPAIQAIAGGLALAGASSDNRGKGVAVSVGAALAFNDITSTTLAEISGSTVNSTGRRQPGCRHNKHDRRLRGRCGRRADPRRWTRCLVDRRRLRFEQPRGRQHQCADPVGHRLARSNDPKQRHDTKRQR